MRKANSIFSDEAMYKTALKRMKERLLEQKVIFDNGCWKFTGCLNRYGYGVVTFQQRQWRVSRLSILIFKPEEYKANLFACHKCNNSWCFNPEHLYMGTGEQNAQDSINCGTNARSSKTHCINGHEFTKENTYIKSNGNRDCRICSTHRRQVNRLYRSMC